jgi:hypothetical protein
VVVVGFRITPRSCLKRIFRYPKGDETICFKVVAVVNTNDDVLQRMSCLVYVNY